MNRPLRYLLPAEGQQQDTDGYDSSDRQSRSRITPRAQVQTACDTCRLKKARCDGNRPQCSRCIRRGETCVYRIDPREHQNRTYLSILQRLRSASDEEAQSLLRRLRASDNISSILSTAEGNLSGHNQPSTIRTARSASPPTFSALEFELKVRHQSVYSGLDIPDAAEISLRDQLLAPGNTYLTSRLGGLASSSSFGGDSLAILSADHGTKTELCDDRLKRLDIGFWTTVPISDDLAARAISTYLQTNHSIMGIFDADTFIDDLVDRRLRFCSPFFVNALLAYSCQTHGSFDPKALRLSPEFIHAAEKLWQAERSRSSVLNVAAILIFSQACSVNNEASGVTATDLFEQGRHMAEQLKLFGVKPNVEDEQHFASLSVKEQRSTAYVAWGAYNWLTYNVFYYPSIRPIEYPPILPIPGANTNSFTGQQPGIPWLPYVTPTYIGRTFVAMCHLSMMLQEIAALYHVRPNSFAAEVPLSFAESKYQQLLNWVYTLEEAMLYKEDSPAHAIVFHMLFHSAVLGVFRPFLQEDETKRLLSFSSPDSSPKAVYRASINQLKRLLVMSHLQHPGVSNISLAGGPLIHVGNAMLQDATTSFEDEVTKLDVLDDEVDECAIDPDWRFYFLLCLSQCQDLLQCFPICASIGRGLLTMAIRNGAISATDARGLADNIQALAEQHSGSIANEDFGEFYLDFGLAATAPEDAQASVLAQRFEELATFDEFTLNDDFVAAEELDSD